MFDVSSLPPQTRDDLRIFLPLGSANSWQQWLKPRGVTMVYMTVIGGGGGGGGGFTGIATSARGGGGGGGSAGIARLLIPAIFVADVLFVQPGVGGAGSTGSGVAGGNGGISYISIGPFPSGTAANIITAGACYLTSSAAVANGGAAGTVSAAGTGGGAAGIALNTSARMGALTGLWQAQVSTSGANGGVHTGAVGGSLTVLGSNFILGGSGGGGTTSADFAGGAQTGAGIFQTIAGGTSSAPNGGNGVTLWNPLIATGGAGGAGINSGVGGNGGVGGIGCGGGGGGGGTTGGTGGAGGDGCVIIQAW